MGDVVAMSREALLERLAFIDAALDILDHYNEETLLIERGEITSILRG